MYAPLVEEFARQHADDLLREAEAARLARASKNRHDQPRHPRSVRGRLRAALAGR